MHSDYLGCGCVYTCVSVRFKGVVTIYEDGCGGDNMVAKDSQLTFQQHALSNWTRLHCVWIQRKTPLQARHHHSA